MQAEGLILAGGKSTRMGGRHKGSLIYGDKTFTHLLVKELKREVSRVRVSYGREIKDEGTGCPVVMDIYPECGPIGGIYAGLRACEREWMLTAACDMPLMKVELYRYLMDMLEKREKTENIIYDGAVPVTDGRIHPLAAVYRAGRPGFRRENMADLLEEQIGRRNYRIRDALKGLNILYADLSKEARFAQMLCNINTIEEYERLKNMND